MRRPSIKTTMIALFGFLAIAFAGLGAVAYVGARDLTDATSDLADHWLAGVSSVDDLTNAFGQERLSVAKHILSTTEDMMAKQEADVDKWNKAQEESEAALAALPLSDEEKELLAKFHKQDEAYAKVQERLFTLSRKNENEQALKVYNEELSPMAANAGEILDRLAEINDGGATAANLRSDDIGVNVSRMVWIALALGGIAVVSGGIFVMRAVVTPVGRITKSMSLLAEGDTESAIPFAGRSDEIGKMAAAVEVFRQAAITNRQLERDAEEARIRAEQNRLADQAQAEADASERLKIATSGLAAGLRRLAAGDLDFQLNERFSEEFEALRQDFNISVGQLGETLSTISQSIGSIDGGTREISVGAQDLSKRTEQQAASLEETAAALDQITVNVKNSTQRTDEARKVAARANDAATKSSEVVGRAVDAMQRIETSSTQISNIIGVIDEIAFQTNLLALNAGVEAARAGEAGKGFAVVAQEVRELAQRAASAAKEIKGLIQTSSAEVEGGVKLVRDTGEALKSIGEFIVEMNGHMQSIASSAQEQSTGLAEVNTAVNAMDQTTQQNAAMVEESTAASASLAMEAERLRDLVGRFKLADAGPAASVTALRQTAARMSTPAADRPAASRTFEPRRPARAAGGAAAAAVPGQWTEF
jgi:methyl-accepting chemotaxis protein